MSGTLKMNVSAREKKLSEIKDMMDMITLGGGLL